MPICRVVGSAAVGSVVGGTADAQLLLVDLTLWGVLHADLAGQQVLVAVEVLLMRKLSEHVGDGVYLGLQCPAVPVLARLNDKEHKRDRLKGRELVTEKIIWKDEPDQHDYPAAESYLSLVAPVDAASAMAARLRTAPLIHARAKDILRASGLRLLETTNPHVAGDLKKVDQGHKLSPVLLVRGDLTRGVPLQIADGYHRVCASYHLDENIDIPCQVIDAFVTPVGK